MWAKGTPKLITDCKKAAQLQEPEQGMALVTGPLTSLAFPSIPQRNTNTEKQGYEKGSAGQYKKEYKVLIPGAQQRKLTEFTWFHPLLEGRGSQEQ